VTKLAFDRRAEHSILKAKNSSLSGPQQLDAVAPVKRQERRGCDLTKASQVQIPKSACLHS
jgi:hypothetical protein